MELADLIKAPIGRDLMMTVDPTTPRSVLSVPSVAAAKAAWPGVPFASPPVGHARFAAPQPVRGWQGVREAFSFGPAPAGSS